VLIIYSALVFILALKHEPWFDEGQAWLLARDASLTDLIWKYLRYEGSTGLWHLLLIPPAKLGLPYHSINYISIAIAIAGVYVFLKYSPFPPVIKTIFPFTYFIFYQYAVVARSYVLMPLLLFSIAVIYKDRYSKPGWFTLLILLLANTNLHGFLISAGILGVNFIELIPKWKDLSKSYRVKQVLLYSAFVLMALFTVAMLWPPEDLEVGKGFNFNILYILETSAITLLDSLTTNMLFQKLPYELYYIIFTIVIAVLVLAMSLVWFKSKKTLLLYAATTIPLLALFTIKYVSVWHEGILFLVWIFVLWISFENKTDRIVINNKFAKLINKFAICMALMFVFVIQVYWSCYVFEYDYFYNYSASRDVADYIKENNLEGKIICATGFHSVSILPYFKENILSNYSNGQKKPSFWLWSTNNETARYTTELNDIIKMKPDLIILSAKMEPLENCIINIPGYKRLRVFEGYICWKDVLYEEDAFVLYEKINR